MLEFTSCIYPKQFQTVEIKSLSTLNTLVKNPQAFLFTKGLVCLIIQLNVFFLVQWTFEAAKPLTFLSKNNEFAQRRS